MQSHLIAYSIANIHAAQTDRFRYEIIVHHQIGSGAG